MSRFLSQREVEELANAENDSEPDESLVLAHNFERQDADISEAETEASEHDTVSDVSGDDSDVSEESEEEHSAGGGRYYYGKNRYKWSKEPPGIKGTALAKKKT